MPLAPTGRRLKAKYASNFLANDAGSDVGFDRLRQRKDDLGTLLRLEQQCLVLDIADVAGLEQHGGNLGTAKDAEIRETVRLRPQQVAPGGLADQPLGKRVADASICSLNARSESIPRTDPSGLARQSLARPVLPRGQPSGLRVRSDVRKRIDCRATRQRVRRAVDVERQIDACSQPASDLGALVECQIAVVVAGQRDANTSPLGKLGAKLASPA